MSKDILDEYLDKETEDDDKMETDQEEKEDNNSNDEADEADQDSNLTKLYENAAQLTTPSPQGPQPSSAFDKDLQQASTRSKRRKMQTIKDLEKSKQLNTLNYLMLTTSITAVKHQQGQLDQYLKTPKRKGTKKTESSSVEKIEVKKGKKKETQENKKKDTRESQKEKTREKSKSGGAKKK